MLLVEETDNLFITCVSGVTIRMNIRDIREAGRATQGVKLINIDEGDKIAAMAKIKEDDSEEEDLDEDGNPISKDEAAADGESVASAEDSTDESLDASDDDVNDNENNDSITEDDSE